MTYPIPIVDLEQFNICKEPEDVSDDVQHQLAKQIIDAFSTVGLNPNRPGELKEAFNICHDTQMEQLWPDDEVPGLRSAGQQFSQQCWTLAQRILLLMGHGLGLDDPSYFSRLHAKSSANNSTTLRCLFYSPLSHGTVVKPNQIRCGEHSDYGSITLLFQDDAGGLELRNRDGEFVPATPVSGTVLVNIGDIMARWTADKLISTVSLEVPYDPMSIMVLPPAARSSATTLQNKY
ncbi:hypothetical protein NP493_2747g00000 [Ridgeia piscesae]|uniref:Fe2OG dioxygenase domain-containing protein n=1 Tax=Ridgeia piscesae TaxID=27915 RepID=A0AAD9JE45_RIDPI|nr:hypothetical protein NP493_2747g00000 [Ridgeia piscesae]